MKLHAPSVVWTHDAWSDGASADTRYPSSRDAAALQGGREAAACQRAAHGSLSTSMRIVGVLAFCHALFFLVLFLFICARAGAAETKSTPALQLNLSTYAAQTQRDPFGSEVPKFASTADVGTNVTAGADSFKLMGILYSPTSPSALINNQLIEVNKPVRIQIGQGEVEVKALEITRDTVVLDAGGQKVELRLGGNERAGESK
jgi:hypothetical protein